MGCFGLETLHVVACGMGALVVGTGKVEVGWIMKGELVDIVPLVGG